MTAIPASNVLELTVGELSGALKRTIEDRFGFVRVRGEISNYRGPHSSGHAYFCLKDDAARIDAVIWKTAFVRLKTKPQEGLEVVATGRVTTFPGKSTYQIVVEAIEPAGAGALMALLETRRKALAAEGLFEQSRKKPIPFLPTTIGVVTSPTGAVIRDILHRLADRFPRNVLVWPVRVQGETAAEEIAAAIVGFNAMAEGGTVTRPDVLIVARGGGSLEDLWAFNEEIVVRAAAASAIPLISAVGHETDWTLIDHASDLRAPTPSGAAEKVVPMRVDLDTALSDLWRRRKAAMLRLVERRRAEAKALARALPTADRVVAMPRQRIDRASERLDAVAASANDRRHLELSRLAHRLAQQAPLTRLARRREPLGALKQRMVFAAERLRDRRLQEMGSLDQRLGRAERLLLSRLGATRDRRDRCVAGLSRSWAAFLRSGQDRVRQSEKLLYSLGYKQVLGRGFALVRDASRQPVRSVLEASGHPVLDIEFADGHIGVTPRDSAPARKPRASGKMQQGTLF